MLAAIGVARLYIGQQGTTRILQLSTLCWTRIPTRACGTTEATHPYITQSLGTKIQPSSRPCWMQALTQWSETTTERRRAILPGARKPSGAQTLSGVFVVEDIDPHQSWAGKSVRRSLVGRYGAVVNQLEVRCWRMVDALWRDRRSVFVQ